VKYPLAGGGVAESAFEPKGTPMPTTITHQNLITVEVSMNDLLAKLGVTEPVQLAEIRRDGEGSVTLVFHGQPTQIDRA
jgi:hypothetical protein